jgi:multidrug resistance efflux pump
MKQNIMCIAVIIIACSCGKKEEAKSNAKTALVDSASLVVKEIIGIGKVVPKDNLTNVASPVSGIVTHVYAKDGDTIKAGVPLLQIDNTLDLIEVEQAEYQIKTQQSQIQIEEAAYKEVDTKLAYKKGLLVSTNNLFTKGAETKQQLDELNEDIKNLEATLKKATATIQLSQNKLNELQNQLQRAKAENRKKQLVAPCNGIILQMQKRQGEAVNNYETYSTIAPSGNLIIDAEIDELFSYKVAIGMPVTIHLIGNETIIAKGAVSMVAPYLKKKSIFSEKANDQEDRRVRSVKISLQSHDELLINTKVECTIKLK